MIEIQKTSTVSLAELVKGLVIAIVIPIASVVAVVTEHSSPN